MLAAKRYLIGVRICDGSQFLPRVRTRLLCSAPRQTAGAAGNRARPSLARRTPLAGGADEARPQGEALARRSRSMRPGNRIALTANRRLADCRAPLLMGASDEPA